MVDPPIRVDFLGLIWLLTLCGGVLTLCGGTQHISLAQIYQPCQHDSLCMQVFLSFFHGRCITITPSCSITFLKADDVGPDPARMRPIKSECLFLTAMALQADVQHQSGEDPCPDYARTRQSVRFHHPYFTPDRYSGVSYRHNSMNQIVEGSIVIRIYP